MNGLKKKRLQAHGWRAGSAAEFLKLTSREAALVEDKARARLIRLTLRRRQLKVTDPASDRKHR